MIEENLFKFINESKTAYNAVYEASLLLENAGYIKLEESNRFNIYNNKKYYIVRNDSSIIAFTVNENIKNGLKLIASHTDSPAFKLKPNSLIEFNGINTVETEVYGGPIYSSWFDRELSVAGRIYYKNENNELAYKIVKLNDSCAIIPNLCIHFNREINNGYKYNPEIDLKPIIGNNNLLELAANSVGINLNDVVSHDLYLVNNQKCTVVNDYFMGPRIDNLASMYLSLKAFIDSNESNKVFVAFNNEETGSRTMQGASSNFLTSILERIIYSLDMTKEDLYQIYANSLLLSADNAHAFHPNYSNKYDLLNTPLLNNGVVIKYNASGAYTSDGYSSSVFKKLCIENNIPYQEFTNKADIRGGSTLGSILQESLSINMVDIGMPQLAMHSAYETAGYKDIKNYYNAMKSFYDIYNLLDYKPKLQ